MTLAITELYPGSVFMKDGKTCCVRKVSRRRKSVHYIDLDGEVSEVFCLTFDQLQDITEAKPAKDQFALEKINEYDWDEAVRSYMLLRPLMQAENSTVAEVDEVAKAAGVNRSTVYRWLNKFATSGRVTSLLRSRRSDLCTIKLDPAVETLISHVISEKILTGQQLKTAKAYRDLERECTSRNVPVPHYNTFRARVRRIAPVLSAEKRRGKNAALPYRAIKGTIRDADTPYGEIQIDHTPVDIILVDSEHRLPLRRPYLTLAICVHTRMIAGYYIAFDPPGALATGICIANAILPKEALLAHFGIDTSWPCQGLPGIIHVDNAREFRGNMLKRACEEYGVELRFRAVKTPQHGAHIERLIGTFMDEVHTLPGTTFSNSEQKGEYDSVENAVMTLYEFEKWLLNLIRAHNNLFHGTLRMPPIQKYLQGVDGSDGSPGVGIEAVVDDAERLRIDFMPFEHRGVHPYGIMVDNITYFSDVLHRWVGARDPDSLKRKRKFLIRRDPRDISFIFFYDPQLCRYFKLPYRDVAHPAISLWELRVVKRYLDDQGRKDVDEEQIFKAYSEMQAISGSAKEQTKRAKQQRLKKERAHTAAAHPTPTLGESGGQSASQAAVEEPNSPSMPAEPPTPFEEVEAY